MVQEPFRLRIATYNVKDLMDDRNDPFHGDERRDPKPPEELAALAESTETLDAGIAGLQEVENERAIDLLLAASPGLEGKYPTRVVRQGNDPTGINVGLMSRYPVTRVRSHRHHRLNLFGRVGHFTRDVLEADLQLPIGPLTAFVAHFKSRRGGNHRSAAIQRAEAEGLVEILREFRCAYPSKRFVVLMDANSDSRSEAVRILTEKTGLVDTGDSLPSGEGDTHRKGGRIDHILLDPALVPYARKTFVLRTPATEKASDHYPLAVDLDLPAGALTAPRPGRFQPACPVSRSAA